MFESAGRGLTIGPLLLSESVLTTWGIVALLALAALLVRHGLVDTPGLVQTAVEGVVTAMQNAVAAVLPEHAQDILPFVASLWMFLVVANLVGLVPGLHSPTADLSVTAALAVLVFLSVHWFGIRKLGLRGYLRHYIHPSPLLLPFHVMAELTRTLALAIRLFGNIMSLEMTALIVVLAAGFLVPVPIHMLHIVEALVQAYIFGILALIYIASGIQVQEERAGAPGPSQPE
jgi:F-type H+-transporting ATPase subunit a